MTAIQDLENPAEVWTFILELCQDIGHKLYVFHKKATGIAIYIIPQNRHYFNGHTCVSYSYICVMIFIQGIRIRLATYLVWAALSHISSMKPLL